MAEAARGWEDIWNTAASAWPSFDVSLEELRAHAGSQALDASLSPPDRAVACDLYLACGCARRDPAALKAFDQTYRAHLHGTVRRLGRHGASADDALQAVYERLFSGAAPKILEYGGTGSLKNWLRVVAVRAVLNLAVRADDEEPFADAEAFGLVADANPELELMKQRYAREFREALTAAAASLDVKERAILRLAFGSNVGIDELGEMYGVHRSTAARWVERAHNELSKRVQKELKQRLHVGDTEYESILRLVASGLDTSLSRYLA